METTICGGLRQAHIFSFVSVGTYDWCTLIKRLLYWKQLALALLTTREREHHHLRTEIASIIQIISGSSTPEPSPMNPDHHRKRAGTCIGSGGAIDVQCQAVLTEVETGWGRVQSVTDGGMLTELIVSKVQPT